MTSSSQNEPDEKTAFISYAREDSAEVDRLYEELRKVDARPWLDKKNIRGGQKWQLVISKAIKNNRYFIPVLSSKWVGKIGYVNKELNYALELLEYYPEDEIFIIPVRLDDCRIPFQKLEGIHFVDLFPDWDSGVKQILEAMKIKITPDKDNQGNQEQWARGLADHHWERLLENIYAKKCIPFIGAGAYKAQNKEGISTLPSTKDIVDRLKEKHPVPLQDVYELAETYKLEDSYLLARLAQFLAIENPDEDEMYPKTLLSKMIKEIDSSKFSPESRLTYDVLADLDLPIYVTTNYDRFLEEALSRKFGKKPDSTFFRWSSQVLNHVKFFKIPSVFDDPKYEPTTERPLVYHVHGDIKHPESMVLTEKDYFDFVINTNKREEQDIYPPLLRTELGQCSLLFVGYTLEDLDFRTIFQGFLTFLDSLGKTRKPSIAVQLPPRISNKERAGMKKYLEQYTKNMFPNVHIFWGDTSEFIKELDKRWKEFKKKNQINTPGAIEVR
jgi:SIR2-like domain/TIR domain